MMDTSWKLCSAHHLRLRPSLSLLKEPDHQICKIETTPSVFCVGLHDISHILGEVFLKLVETVGNIVYTS